jgi:hypothetical protein
MDVVVVPSWGTRMDVVVVPMATNEVESGVSAQHDRKMDGVLLSTMAVWINGRSGDGRGRS